MASKGILLKSHARLGIVLTIDPPVGTALSPMATGDIPAVGKMKVGSSHDVASRRQLCWDYWFLS